MTTSCALYHEIHSAIWPRMRRHGVRATSIQRLILLVLGILAAQSVVVRQMTARLEQLEIGHFGAVRRRLQRTLADPRVQDGVGYDEAVRETIAWDTLERGSALVLIVDETTQDDRTHLIRVGLAYRGTAVSLAWAVWAQNTAQPADSYGEAIERVLARAARIVPADQRVIVVADRAYDVASFVDRVARHGWHWVIRAKERGTLRVRDRHGERSLVSLLRQHLGEHRGARWKTQGKVFKKAGWRTGSVVALRGTAGLLVVISDLPARWSLLAVYRRRFWIESSFRNDKSAGWHWEQNQGTTLAAQEALVVAMAWATLLVLCLGAQAAERACHTFTSVRLPEHARDSLFSLGRRALHAYLIANVHAYIPWILPDLGAPSWNTAWKAKQAHSFIFGIKTVHP